MCCDRGVVCLVVLSHGQALAVEDSGFAGAAAFGQDSANFCSRGRVDQRSGDETQLHAQSVGALFQDDDRPQWSQLFRVGFQDAVPLRAQPLDLTRAAEIDA